MSDSDPAASHDNIPGIPEPSQARVVFGHDSQTRFLVDAYRSGKLHHALMFHGTAGIGKASLAFLFARHVIANPDWARSPNDIDLNVGDSLVQQIAAGSHGQVLYLTRPVDQKTGKHKTQLTIDETRRIGHFLSRTIAGGGYRIVIIDPVNDMNGNAANALLKNLEEPTPRTLFILIAHSSGRLLPTIRSRCLQLRFAPLGSADMHSALDKLGITGDLTGGRLERLVLQSAGSPRTAAMLIESGGMEILDAATKVISTQTFDMTAALKIGEAVSSRDREALYLLLTDELISLTARTAGKEAIDGSAKSATLATLHTALSEKVDEGMRFNLDRRQTVSELLFAMHGAMSG